MANRPYKITKAGIEAMDAAGMNDLVRLQTAGISGLNPYYKVTKTASYPYARVGQFPQHQINKL
jgi:hypothetical protein